MKKFAVSALVLSCLATLALAQMPTGWSCYSEYPSGKVYRFKTGGSAQALYNGTDARHARWSVDGKLIFFIKSNSDIWAMNNDGTNQRKIGTGRVDNDRSDIAAYRPDAACILSVEGGNFYKINANTLVKTLIYTTSVTTFAGEIAISADGTRLVARQVGTQNQFKMTVNPSNPNGSAPVQYASLCSGGISADGQWVMHNGDNHQFLVVMGWSGSPTTTLNNTMGTWDNQSFVTNSSDWICALLDDPFESNHGHGIAIVNRANNQMYKVAELGTIQTCYPDFFLGNLPGVSAAGPAASHVGSKQLHASTYSMRMYDTRGRVLDAAAQSGMREHIRGVFCIKEQRDGATGSYRVMQ